MRCAQPTIAPRTPCVLAATCPEVDRLLSARRAEEQANPWHEIAALIADTLGSDGRSEAQEGFLRASSGTNLLCHVIHHPPVATLVALPARA